MRRTYVLEAWHRIEKIDVPIRQLDGPYVGDRIPRLSALRAIMHQNPADVHVEYSNVADR